MFNLYLGDQRKKYLRRCSHFNTKFCYLTIILLVLCLYGFTETVYASTSIENILTTASHQKLKHAKRRHYRIHKAVVKHSSNEPAILTINAAAAYVFVPQTQQAVLDKNSSLRLPIASITKLMTAIVMLDARPNLEQSITITDDDIDRIKNTFSRLAVGMSFSRRELLLLALMSSENRAAHALARTTFVGGTAEFIKHMNSKAKELNMHNTSFADPAGLAENSQSTAQDLVKLVNAASFYPLIHQFSTTKSLSVQLGNILHEYHNTDSLVRDAKLNIKLSKTGFTNEAGHCLVLYTIINHNQVIMALLNSKSAVHDAYSIAKYLAKNH